MVEFPLVIDLNIPCIADYVSVVRLAVSGIAARLNFTVDDIEDIKVAVSEVCTNAIQHAYPDNSDGRIDAKFKVFPKKLEIVISDKGQGFDPDNISSTKKQGGDVEKFGLGLGLTFVKTLMDEAIIKSKEGQGTTISMIKNIAEK